MRKRGASIRDIEMRLGIARSTLSYWLRHISISKFHSQNLERRAEQSLVKARKAAVKWHNAEKAARLDLAKEQALQSLSKIDTGNSDILELALALLYLGEGNKKSDRTAMGNSDPIILCFFVSMLQRLYDVPLMDMKCELHLRADQQPEKLIDYWSKALNIPRENFGRPILDQRTTGRPTYLDYKGVCVVRCSRVAIQRKLGYIATTFCCLAAEMRG